MLRRLIVHFLGMLLLVGLLAPPAAAEEVVVLAGTNVVTGSTTSRVAVRLERDAVLDLTPPGSDSGSTLPAAVQVEGDGEFVGFALTEPLSTDGFFAVAVRTPALGPDGVGGFVGYGQQAAEHRGDAGPLSDEATTCVRCVVPAGDYHLYLVTGFRDAKVTFTLENLTGATDFGTDGRPLRTNEGMGAEENWFRGDGAVMTGGGMGQWFWTSHESPEPGLLVHAYRTTATKASAVPLVAAVEHCEGTSGQTSCEQDLDTDGLHDSAGFAVTGGTMTDQMVSASVDLTVTGAASYTVGQAMLWLPLNHFIRTVGVGVSDDPDEDSRFNIATW